MNFCLGIRGCFFLSSHKVWGKRPVWLHRQGQCLVLTTKENRLLYTLCYNRAAEFVWGRYHTDKHHWSVCQQFSAKARLSFRTSLSTWPKSLIRPQVFSLTFTANFWLKGEIVVKINKINSYSSLKSDKLPQVMSFCCLWKLQKVQISIGPLSPLCEAKGYASHYLYLWFCCQSCFCFTFKRNQTIVSLAMF